MNEFVTAGMTLEAARAAAAEHGYRLRVLPEDGVGHATGDLRPVQDRLNVEVEDGVVVRVLGTW